MNEDQIEYYQFTGPARLDKEFHTLEGIIRGIGIDNQINTKEIEALLSWCDKHEYVSSKHPFNEIIPLIKQSLEDHILDEEEKKDIIWLCKQYTSQNKYYDHVTSDMQRLQGILAGIVADGVIEENELLGLKSWLSDKEHLRSIWPFDEIDSLITEVLSDGIIDEQEHYMLVNFCNQFLEETTSMILDLPFDAELLKTGVCASTPEIKFPNNRFCFTGKMENGTRKELSKVVIDFGGSVNKGVTQDLNYLVVGGEGNDCWAFSCYGRKVEKAMNYRKAGHPIQIVHEFDFFDAVQDFL